MGKVRSCEGSNVFVSKQAEKIFSDAVELDIAAREDFLDNTCANDAVLRREVDSLLTAAANADEFFDGFSNRLNEVSIPCTAIDGPDIEQIGPWRLLYLLGRGGMGAVYLAERADHQYQRRVALKLLSSNAADPVSRFRFQAEKNILARLQHDNIAHFIDGAVTENGMPYIVLEYIDGVPLDQYCREKALPIRERLGLFLKVCEAVHYAHRNLVIHRDLKPANVLVDHEGNVKLLDFGIAKISGNNNAHSDLTQIGFRPVTPAYASPEMLRGEEVDVTSDVYSLGVLLYELLTGELPGVADPGNHQTEKAPNKSKIKEMRKLLKGDIYTIILKALKPHKNERYESVRRLSDDIEYYLADKPVIARPESTIYLIKKFLIRHRIAVGVTFLAASALVIITALSVYNVAVKSRQSKIILAERDRAESIKSFLIDIFETADPTKSPKNQTAEEIVNQSFEKINNELLTHPYTKMQLYGVFADIYGNLHLTEKAVLALEKELSIKVSLDGKENTEYVDRLIVLMETLEGAGDYEGSMAKAKESLALSERIHYRGGTARALQGIGRVHHLKGEYSIAEPFFLKAMNINSEVFGEESPELSITLLHLGYLMSHMDNYTESEKYILKSLEITEKTVGEKHHRLGEIYMSLGYTRKLRGDYVGSLNAYQKAIDIFRSIFGDEGGVLQFAYSGLAAVHKNMGEYDLAKKLWDKAIEIASIHNPENPNMGLFLADKAGVHRQLGEYVEAVKLFERAIPIVREGLPNHWYLYIYQLRYGHCLAKLKRFDEAEPLVIESVSKLRDMRGADNRTTIEAVNAAVEMYTDWGRQEEVKKYSAMLY